MTIVTRMADKDSSPRPEEYYRALYKRQFRSALVRGSSSLVMWFFALGAYSLSIISTAHFTGISLAVLYLIAINPPMLLIFKRIRKRGWLATFSYLINLLEAIGYTAVIYFTGGIDATYLTLLYAALIGYVGSVSNPQYTFLVSATCIALYDAMIILEGASLIPWFRIFPEYDMPWSHRLIRMFVADGLLLVLTYIVSYTASLLRKARSDLLRSYEALEERVAERTTELSRAIEILREEIAERKRAEEALRFSEESYRSLVENSMDTILLLDLERRIVSVNRTFCQ